MPNAGLPPYKIAFVDLENSPSLGYAWAKFDQNILHFEQEWYTMSFAWKWAHEKKGHVVALPDFPLYKKEPENDFEISKVMWEVFNEADLIIGHNIVDYDIRKANTTMLLNGLQPPSPAKTVDTLKLMRSKFALLSNKLGDVASALGCTSKMDSGGFDLWLRCIQGDMKAWATMKKYNLQDVYVVEEVYDIVKPWHDHHPNINLLSPKNHQCPVCGSQKVQRRGESVMKSFKAQRYQCTSCGHWSRGKRERIQAQLLS